MRQALAQSKDFSGMDEVVGSWTGKTEFEEIAKAIDQSPPRAHRMLLNSSAEQSYEDEQVNVTPPATQNCKEPPGAPFLPDLHRMPIPPMVSGHDAVTPTPGGGVAMM